MINQDKLSTDNSLHELISNVRGIAHYLIKKIPYIFIVAIIGGAVGLTYGFFQKTSYTASLTFTVDDDRSSSPNIAGALGIASSLGLDIGGGSSGSVFSGANLMELMKSRTLVSKALLTSVKYSNKSISLADLLLKINSNSDISVSSSTARYFPTADSSGLLTRSQDSVLGLLYQQINGRNGLLTVSLKDKKTTIIQVDFRSSNELFSKYFVEALMRVVSDYYIETKSKKAKQNLDILQKQTDSVRQELEGAITGVAIAADNAFNLNPAYNIKRTPSTLRQVDVQANSAILTQLVTNLEIAKVTLRKDMPLIQVIDKPVLPLNKIGAGKVRFTIIGFVVGLILACATFILKQRIKNLLTHNTV